MRSLAFRARARASMARITALSAASFVMFTITSAFRTSSNASFALAKNKKIYERMLSRFDWNTFTPNSDRSVISPDSIDAPSSRRVIRIKEVSHWGCFMIERLIYKTNIKRCMEEAACFNKVSHLRGQFTFWKCQTDRQLTKTRVLLLIKVHT